MAAGWVFLFRTYFNAPPAVAVLFPRAGSAEILQASIIWFAILVGLGLAMGSTSGKMLGWPLILGIFFTTPGVLALIAMQRMIGLHLPLFTF